METTRLRYALLASDDYVADLGEDVLELGDEAFLPVRFEAPEGRLLVKLGWEFERRRGCWLTSRWDWHDFRGQFHPGIDQEEWTRICG